MLRHARTRWDPGLPERTEYGLYHKLFYYYQISLDIPGGPIYNLDIPMVGIRIFHSRVFLFSDIVVLRDGPGCPGHFAFIRLII